MADEAALVPIADLVAAFWSWMKDMRATKVSISCNDGSLSCSSFGRDVIAAIVDERSALKAENERLTRERDALARSNARMQAVKVDALAQEIRRVDGSHSLGAGALAEALMPFLSTITTEPAAQEGWQEAGRIGDAVLDWMVKFDLLDAGNEYYVSDVLAVLNDLTPSTHPSEQAVTEAARVVLEWYERDGSVGGAVEPFEALKAAMEAGRHE